METVNIEHIIMLAKAESFPVWRASILRRVTKCVSEVNSKAFGRSRAEFWDSDCCAVAGPEKVLGGREEKLPHLSLLRCACV